MELLDIALSSIEFLTFREKNLLRETLSCADELCSLGKEDIASIIKRQIRSEGWDGKRCLALAERAFAVLERFGIKAFSSRDKGYPVLFQEIFDPPYMVFARGDIGCLGKKCVSVVGTRRICPECAENTIEFASDCASDGLTVASGLAYGVDTFAHKGVLSVKGGSTAAVLPCGIDTVMPRGNVSLAARILESGGVLLSEYLPGVPSESWRYVKRNRLIAALSPVTVVMQAPPGSGALITVDFALGYNRIPAFHKGCFCDAAEKLVNQAKASLIAKNTGAALRKLEFSCESYVKEGAPVFGNYEEFSRILNEADFGSQIHPRDLELEF
ncbi:MAG: DNA-protecting protein DprA [Treponema sp.]|nr:DNA-protecting protein DprA [Treponema sp.]MBQ5383396.1 DNA-protecting protein DprA [Treponema sp.]